MVRGVEPLVDALEPHGDSGDHRPEFAQRGPDVAEARLDSTQPSADRSLEDALGGLRRGVGDELLERDIPRRRGRLPRAERFLGVEEVRPDASRDLAVA
ncbi:hypothetical protein [Streptomyces sp. KR80]|uniref:hypothetical protein n=1 Tax=Streptomyces sp. KR80 TaxID=3457426 RepID=UPI003FD4C453